MSATVITQDVPWAVHVRNPDGTTDRHDAADQVKALARGHQLLVEEPRRIVRAGPLAIRMTTKGDAA